ncbi:hypothetical protein MKZ19_07465 [Shouchella clausii]|uniref:class III lanthionine synthetase LanKC N-terminal domain-containing protein n=1 Tax=Shouchella clausii TaxID=79880 RepID=UPI0031FE3E19
MSTEMIDYLNYSTNRDTLFYSINQQKSRLNKSFEIPNFDVNKWSVYSDKHWTNLIFNEKDFPEQGWKIHVSADINEASSLLYDVAEYLICNEVSFKYVPNLGALSSKNAKYADRSASGKFITVYPENNDVFFRLLNDLKEVTKQYELGPYILNDQQWQGSNVFFRYGGLKRILTYIDGKKL